MAGTRSRRWRPARRVVTVVLAGAAALATATPAAAKAAPDTAITSAPPGATSSTSATFAFAATVPGSAFRCRLDTSAATPCTSPRSYSGLAAGRHTFRVTATANGRTERKPAVARWTVDDTPPLPATDLSATAGSAAEVMLAWTPGTDNIAVTGYQILRDSSLVATVGPVRSYADTTVAPASSYRYQVVALDAAGNAAGPSNTAAVVTPPSRPTPATVIDAAPAGVARSTTATFAFHATVRGVRFRCALDGAPAARCASPARYAGLGQGPHTFTVTARATGAGALAPVTVRWRVDTVTPTTPGQPTALVSGRPPSVGLSWAASADGSGVSGYDVYRDGALLAGTSTPAYRDSTVVPGHTYRYLVRARDAGGHVSAPSTPAFAVVAAPYSPHLTRAPYLTDLVGLRVAVNFATDRSGTVAKVRYGRAHDGTCIPVAAAPTSRTVIRVGDVVEYQWTAELALPRPGSYCYRPYLGADDLLAANPSPRFTAQVPAGSDSRFSFDVFGDWGQVDAAGVNQDQADLMAQLAASGARFAVTVGDNGYPNGSQTNYGDLQQRGANTSAVFGAPFWTVAGSSLPIFTAPGNHGVAGRSHTDISTWTQVDTVAESDGRYRNDVYCCVNESAESNYGSEWYAFTAGDVRFYVLDSAWGDLNSGAATPYADDAVAHFGPGTPEYTWLLHDLQTHPSRLKFAFSHYPLYVDNATEPSDSALDGAAGLEGLLATHGVQMIFNGHAHLYERNVPSGSGMPVTYVTGGGGGTLEPLAPCSALDAYAIGWNPVTDAGSACGRAKAPAQPADVYHFLKVTVSGTTVTVAPTNSLGATFDVRTYQFHAAPDTELDAEPPAGSSSTTASFTFHAAAGPARFACSLDAAPTTACTSPKTYTGLSEGRHTFAVTSTVDGVTDPTPARYSWTVARTPPTAPTVLQVRAASPFLAELTWGGATDDTGVTGYRIYRDGQYLQTVGPDTRYADPVLGSTGHTYAVTALDAAGTASPPSPATSITMPPAPAAVFQDGFESGNLTAWTASAGLTIESDTVRTGNYAAEGATEDGDTYATETLAGHYSDGYARAAFCVVWQASQIDLMRLLTPGGVSIGYLYLDPTGRLAFHDDATDTNTVSPVVPGPGWHAVELRIRTDRTAGRATGIVQVWLDDSPVADLSRAAIDVGHASIGGLQLGTAHSGGTYDVAFDDAAFGAGRLGPVPATDNP